MPTMPSTFRPRGARSRKQQRRDYDRRRDEQPWRRWYKTARWQKLRARQLAVHPLCVMCEAEGRVTPATRCDHVERHGGDPAKFWGGPFQSLCQRHHDSDKQREERSAEAGRGGSNL